MKLLNFAKTYTGKHLHIYTLTYMDELGGTQEYEIASRNPNLTPETLGKQISGIAIMAFDKNHDKILLTREFRMGLNQYIIDVPAGMYEHNETTEQAAARELFEETGLTLTKTIKTILPSYTAGPITDDMTRLLICEAEGDIKPCKNLREDIQADWYTRSQVVELLKQPEKTISLRAQMLCYGWITNEIRVQTPDGTLCATGDETSNYPGIYIDMLTPDGEKTRLAMTEFIPDTLEPGSDYVISQPGEDTRGTLKVPDERISDGKITPGLVSRTYPNTNPMDDEEHVTFHYTKGAS